jgi:hypothetical protein
MHPDMLDCNVPVRRKLNRRLVSAQSLAPKIRGMVVIKTCRAKCARIIAPMTQARTASHGVVTPPPLDRWIDAVLMLFVELVHGVATTLGMGCIHRTRECHTTPMPAALPQAKSDIQLRNDTAVVAATRASTPPPNGGGAPRTALATSGLRWGTALTNRTVRTRRTTVSHLTRASCAHHARSSSPAHPEPVEGRGRNTSAHA